MSLVHHYFGLLGCMMLLIALPLVYIRQPRHGRKVVTIFIFAMMAFSILPIYELAVVAYIRGVISDLSITSMVLLAIFIAEAYTGTQYVSTFERRHWYRLVLITGLVLYPFALGLTPWDSYHLGYGSYILLAALMFILFCQMIAHSWFILTALLLAISAYLAGVLTSDNLWDYLIDVWLFLYVVIAYMWEIIRKSFHKMTTA